MNFLWTGGRPLTPQEQERLQFNISRYFQKHREGRTHIRSVEEVRSLASAWKDTWISRLAEHLETLERHLHARGVQVLWAETARDVQEYLQEIVRTHRVRLAVKSKSLLSEECQVRTTLKQIGVSVYETDLGAFIVQVRNERPYHIVTPAMHLRRKDAGESLAPILGTPPDASAETLSRSSARFLRKKLLQADLGILSTNFWIGKEGILVFTENEGNIRMCALLPEVLVILVGIDRGLPSLESLALFLPLLAIYGTGQTLTVYNRLWYRPLPHQTAYVIFVDNGRSQLYSDPERRTLFRCIRCGACLYICPVYAHTGGFGYPHVYSGPIGIAGGLFWGTPMQKARMPWLCSQCGACSDICPVRIPLHTIIRKNRKITTSRWKRILWQAFWKLFLTTERLHIRKWVPRAWIRRILAFSGIQISR